LPPTLIRHDRTFAQFGILSAQDVVVPALFRWTGDRVKLQTIAPTAIDISPLFAEPDQQVPIRDLYGTLEGSVGAWPARHQTVFVTREILELKTAETASVLGAHGQCVKTRLHRAKLLPRRALRRHAGPPSARFCGVQE
jgi:DNA-directed RNA polymerase specialized sigma24 family protein